MGYDLHITRAVDGIESESKPISLEEWKRAVAVVPGIRLDDRPVTVTNPKTGERITVSGRDGDVAVLLNGAWVKVFHYGEGQIRFKAGPVDLDDPEDEVAATVFSLVQILSAKIVGDEGEVYEVKAKSAERVKGKKGQRGQIKQQRDTD